MKFMKTMNESDRASVIAVGVGLSAAAVFETLTVLETQVTAIWAASPWKDDPYLTPVSLAGFAVPALAVAVALRLLAGRVGDRANRARRSVRAVGVMTGAIGLALVSEWAAVIAGGGIARRPVHTSFQIAGLILTSLLSAIAAALLSRCPPPDTSRSDPDWLGDAVLLGRCTPGLRRWAEPSTAEWVRRRAMTVFVGLSLAAAAVVTAAQAIGERLTDPVLIAWFLITLAAADLAFCVISNAVVGFIARAPRSRPRRIVEASVVTGCLGLLVAVGFHDALWSAVGTGALTAVGLAGLTLGTGLAAGLVTAAILTVSTRRGHHHGRDRVAPA